MTECKNCHTLFEGKYCNNCGQKRFEVQDKSLKSLVGEAFHFMTHFEGTFFVSLKAILFHPGRLSADYSEGIRRRYFKPVSMFFLIVILYLVFPFFPGLNLAMESYRSLPVTGNIIASQIENKVRSEKVTEAVLSEKFIHSSEKVSKIFLFLLVVFSAMIIAVLFRKMKNYVYDNMILAVEINIFYILIFYILFSLLLLPFKNSLNAYAGKQFMEYFFSLIILCFFIIYSSILFRRVFRQSWGICLLKGLLFSVLHALFLMLIYRPIVFEITFALI